MIKRVAIGAVSGLLLLGAATAAPALAKVINMPGAVFDAQVCDLPQQLTQKGAAGCKYYKKRDVTVLEWWGGIAKIQIDGAVKYALTTRTLVHSKGTDVPLYSYVTGG